MKYFAKYLPVEGEIKEGNLYISDSGDVREAGKCPAWTGNIKDLFSQCKKVKLFLCSRDIQIGDTPYGYENMEVAKIEQHEDINYRIVPSEPCTHNGYWITNIFKVIGEISPDAIWVKEGDEFDEDEVRNLYIRREGRREFLPISAKVSINSSKQKTEMLGIKCSQCNTFH